MDRETIIRLAREAGLYVGTNMPGAQLVGIKKEDSTVLCHIIVEELERFAALVAAHERDECAAICRRLASNYSQQAMQAQIALSRAASEIEGYKNAPQPVGSKGLFGA